jgi:peptidoglycan L-alanyl-D-glutamate endopeptidase CwlK
MTTPRLTPTDLTSCLHAGASPELAPLLRAWAVELERLQVPVLVYTVYRSNEAQRILYAQGRTAPGRIVTNARPGQSAHNRTVGLLPASDAFDACPLIDGKPSWLTTGQALSFWDQMGAVAQQFGLMWGRHFVSLGGDWAHFEYHRTKPR